MRVFDFSSPALHAARSRRDVARVPSELAILGFAAFSLFGAIGMSFYCGIGLSNAGGALKPAAEVPVYNGKAVPRDHPQKRIGAAEQVVRRHTITTMDAAERANERLARSKESEKTSASHQVPVLGEDTRYSFPDMDLIQQHGATVGGASAAAHSGTSQYASANIEAPDSASASVAAVPEPASWSVAGVFALLLCAGERLRRRKTRPS